VAASVSMAHGRMKISRSSVTRTGHLDVSRWKMKTWKTFTGMHRLERGSSSVA